MQKKYMDLQTLVICALLAAMGAVLKTFLSVDLFFGSIKIMDLSLIILPVMLAGIYFGPLAGGIVGFVAESIGYFMLFGVGGAYNPIFSIIMALAGVIAGLFYMRSPKTSVWKTIVMVTVIQVLCRCILTPLAIYVIFAIPLAVLLPSRGISLLIMTPVLTVILTVLVERLRPIITRRRRTTMS